MFGLPWIGLFWLATLMACLATLTGFLGRWVWLFELSSHFRVQYFLFFLLATVVFLALRRYKPATFLVIFALINLLSLLPLYWPLDWTVSTSHAQESSFRVLQYNVNHKNRDHEKFLAFVEKTTPDFIVLEEVTLGWINALEKIQKQFPYQKSHLRRNSSGIAIISRLPFQEAEIQYIGKLYNPSAVIKIDLSGQTLTIIGVHLLSPTSPFDSHYRNKELEELAQFASAQTGPVMVIGDLNITSWSPYFQDFIKHSGLRDSRKGFGVQASWPSGQALLWIPIDHYLVSEEVVVLDRQIGPDIGSDHYPVIMDFSLLPSS